jgi:hypothetical protein
LRRFVRQTRAILVCEQAQRYIPISDCDARERLRAAMARSHHHATALLAIALLVGAQSSRPATAFELSMPIECDVGTSCVIQNYVDHDPSAGYRDFRCGSLTYDGHGGTDFRLLDMASQRRGVNVLAASKGKVVRLRNDMADVMFNRQGEPLVDGRECGNGVLLDHDDGWQTQYCHMAKGSIRVKVGQIVEKGDALGLVGLSGNTEFPHLHLTVRQNGKVVDPFAFGASPQACGGGSSLWAASLQSKLSYRPRHVLNSGFADAPVSMTQIESGELSQSFAPADATAIVAYVRVIGLQAGDRQRLILKYRDGQVIADSSEKDVERAKAQFMIFTGKKRPAGGWLAARFVASYRVINNGQTVLSHDFEFTPR